MTSEKLVFRRYAGAEIATVFDGLAALRIAVFREFPYLYEGSPAYEKTYLDTYAKAPQALLLAVFDGNSLVGATTCLPLCNETDDVQAPFIRAGFDLDRVFYFGESLLLPPYRGLGIGHRFFNEREAHTRSVGRYAFTCFCAVQRPLNHPLRPASYRPLDAFWQQRGYQPNPALQTTFTWPDIGETTETAKPMQFWVKAL